MKKIPYNIKIIIDSFNQWYIDNSHSKNENIYNDEITKIHLSQLTDEEFIKFFFEFAKNGGYIQSQGQRNAGKFVESIKENMQEFRKKIIEPFQENFDELEWLSWTDKINYFGKGLATIYLNRVNKYKHAIVNKKSILAYENLGFEIKKTPLSETYESIKESQLFLINEFPEIGNFYIADSLSHFLIGVEEGRRLLHKYFGVKMKSEDLKKDFLYFLKNTDQPIKNDSVAKLYANTIDKISSHYSENENDKIDLYQIEGPQKLNDIEKLYSATGKYSEFGSVSHGTNIAALRSYIRFINSKNINYWVFQANPKFYDIIGSLKIDLLSSWQVNQFSKEIKEGDKVILWISGEKGGIYALADVISDVYEFKDEEDEEQFYIDPENNIVRSGVKLQLTDNFVKNPILRGVALSVPELANLNVGRQGTNFKATSDQYNAILNYFESIDKREQRLLDTIKVLPKNEVLFFYETLDKIFNNSKIKCDSEKLCLSVKEQGEMNVTVGRRYVFRLVKKKSRFQYYYISPDPINENAYEFKAPNDAYYNLTTSKESLISLIDDIAKSILIEWNRSKRSPQRYQNNSYFSKSVFDIDYRNKILNMLNNKKMKSPLNQILFGPPGTGKTYHTINKAIKIINPEFKHKTRKELKEEYEKLVEKGQIVFTTFHQSMNYEDFIEGIKPKIKKGDIEYEIKDGIFKEISKKSFLNIIRKDKDDLIFSFERLWNSFLTSIKEFEGKDKYIFKTITESELKLVEIRESGNLAVMYRYNGQYQEVPATSTLTASKDKIRVLYENDIIPGQVETLVNDIKPLVKSHASLLFAVYEKFWKFVENKLEQTDGLSEKEIDFDYIFNEVKSLKENKTLKSKIKNSEKFVLIIDEVNRGNVSQIFGELITLIEEDKRIGKKEELKITLPYSKKKFGVPPNLYIMGTMNTADRSIEALDTALRRRFSFKEMPPNTDVIENEAVSSKVENVDLVKLLETINLRIEKLIDKDHMVGHSYFLNIKEFKDLRIVFKDKIIPLLEEYFYGDYGKINLILGNAFVQKKDNKNEFSFAKDSNAFESDIIDDLKNRTVYFITNYKDWEIEDFTKIYK